MSVSDVERERRVMREIQDTVKPTDVVARGKVALRRGV